MKITGQQAGDGMNPKETERKLADYAVGKDICVLYLFGSAATGRRTALSDIDIAVLLPASVAGVEYFDRRLEMTVELMGVLGENKIDLVILNEAPPLLRQRVVTSGTVIYCRDEKERNGFEARAILEYLDFKPVLDLQYQYLKERLQEGRFGVRPRYHKVATGED
jgi:predicted nucleotidyltransferase